LVIAGCDDPLERCPARFVGDSAKPPEIQMLFTDGKSMMLSLVNEGDTIPMEPPPQGGLVMYIGAAVRNMDACSIELAGSLRDPDTHAQLGFDARNTDLIPTSQFGEGWAHSDPSNNSNEANVNSCPDYSDKDRHNGEFMLEMKATDRAKRTVSISHRVKLVCDPTLNATAYSECVCTCSANYHLGKCNGFALDLSLGP
jgi:hypothetical protein